LLALHRLCVGDQRILSGAPGGGKRRVVMASLDSHRTASTPARGCGRTLHPCDAWTCDHIQAVINGDPNRESNLHPLCEWCEPRRRRPMCTRNRGPTAGDSGTPASSLRRRGVPYRAPLPAGGNIGWISGGSGGRENLASVGRDMPQANGPGGLSAQCPKPITQHGYPKSATPRIDPAQDLVDRPNEKSAFENYFESHA
jgi:HNH endonuclease